MRKIAIALICWLSCVPVRLPAQDLPIRAALMHGDWPAGWITCPGVAQRAYGVYHFRKTFELGSLPATFIVHVSADNRYRLFVNGKAVCAGPARGDLAHWNFETIDIAPFLQAGTNTLAALVWNMGEYAAVGQVSNQTAFLLQGDSGAEEVVNTNHSWKVMQDSAYRPCSTDNGARLRTYMVVGPGDDLDATKYPWGWEQPGFADGAWVNAAGIAHGVTTGYGTDNLWTLVPRTIPLMEEELQRIPVVRRGMIGGESTGDSASSPFKSVVQPIIIPAHDSAVILFDQTFETVAYPELLVGRGKGSLVRMTYAEALLDEHLQKGNRNEIKGRKVVGDYDLFRPDGGMNRLFRPLWMRTYRYLQLEVVTGDDELIIEDLRGVRTGYPFRRTATFNSNDPSLTPLWDVGWRTARLCAGETYFDCPYYEQLQYEGDTRIQSLISLYVTGDDRLMKKAITDFYDSRVAEGLTQGRYPSNRLQVIPPFSLWWIVMIHDYWMLRKDDGFIRQFLPAVRGVLDWYEGHVDTTMGMLGPMPWWGFVDWADAFGSGVPPGAPDGHSAVISLQYAYTLRQAAELFGYFGGQYGYTAQRCRKLAADLNRGTYRACYDPSRGEMANTPEKNSYSQHAGILAVLADAIPAGDRRAVMGKILSDGGLQQATFYFRFYLMQAMKAAGMADRYYSQLGPWRQMLTIGLTTFAEKPEPTRSDCHAWSASPDYDFLATICGIMPDAPGFGRVLIRPALGELTKVEGSMPHPKGMIRVKLEKKGAGISGEVELPEGVSGRFVYGGKEVELHGGRQMVKL
jgi:alpha-L-rhamnosidase